MTRRGWSLVGLGVASVLTFAFGLTVGSADVGWAALADFVTGRGSLTETERLILLESRLPRVLGAWITGAGLSIVGVAMQALVRNPLAEPYILGISGGASAGASLFYMGLLPPVFLGAMSVSLAAFLGALATIVLVYAVARTGDGLSVTRLLLAGVALASLTGALSSFVSFASPDANRLRAVLFWLLGSFSGLTLSDLPVATAAALLGLGILMVFSRSLDALLLGEEPAAGLGIPVERMKHVLIVLAALVTGTLVAISGAIGFVGLIVPHVVRGFTGVSHRYVVPAAFLGGGLFLVAADALARSVLPGQEIPVGIVSSIAGVPFFLVLLRRQSWRFKNLS